MTDHQVIDLIRNGEQDKALDMLYKNFPAFQNSFVKSGGLKSVADDIFQDALLIFIEKTIDANFTFTCSIPTFLFSICKNLSLIYFKKNKNLHYTTIEIETEYIEVDGIEEFLEKEKQFKLLDKVLAEIGKKCLEILQLFYAKGIGMKMIAEKMGFSNEISAKTQKYKCIEKARELSRKIIDNNMLTQQL